MKPLFKNRHIYWILQVLGWGSAAVLSLIFKYLTTLHITDSDIGLAVLIFVLGILYSNFIRFVYKYFKWHEQDLVTILHKVALLAVLTAVVKLLTLQVLVNICPDTVHQSFGIVGFAQYAIRFSILYFFWGVLYFIVYFFTNFKKTEIINLKNKAQMNAANLNKLKSQLNPHFMFNAMNVIRALIDEDSSKAKDGITQLSNILRHTLNVNQQKLITIKEELEIVSDYLSLEKLRFEERLHWENNIDQKFMRYSIPPMLLQTIVENGIKHGIANLVQGGQIKLHAEETEDGFSVCVVSDGQYNENNKSKGLGLRNSRERLFVIFGDQAEITIKNLNDHQVISCVRLPKQLEK
ncbi:MAG: sensor histidine kinase YesM [Glaciecola sp.]|jgi:sensor histidine kinase YesM